MGHALLAAECFVNCERLVLKLFRLVKIATYLVDHAKVAIRPRDSFL